MLNSTHLNFSFKQFSTRLRSDYVLNSEIRKKLQKKYGLGDIPKIISKDSKEAMMQYESFIKEREDRKLNFNRKNRWEQRELDDIMKNFDIKSAKFKDYAKIIKDNFIINDKVFSSIEEVFFYIDSILSTSEYLSEDVISNCLDVFIKDFDKFKAEDLENPIYKKFVRQAIIGITSYAKESTLMKAAKFFDWYNVEGRNCWYNLERVITNKLHSSISPNVIINILNNFANQNEGSGEFYDLYQYLFWSGKFSNSPLPDVVSLGYNMFITDQGYDLFYWDLSTLLMDKLDMTAETFDIVRIVQIFSNLSEFYKDLYFKLEEIILKRQRSLDLTETTTLACGFAISGYGTPELFMVFEQIILKNFHQLDKHSFRDVVRAYIISTLGSDKTFLLVLGEFINKSDRVSKFTITETVYIMKCFHDKLRAEFYYKKIGVKSDTIDKFFSILEESLMAQLSNPEKVFLEEICSVCHYYCSTKIVSRDLQKQVESLIQFKIKDLKINPQISKFLYDLFLESGMCSSGLMNVLCEIY